MAMKSKLFSIFLLFSLSFLFLSLAGAKQDPELKQCKHQCRVQQQFGEKQREQCEQRCEDYYKQKQEGERGRGEREQGNPDPEKEFHECRKRCQQQEKGQQQRRVCEKQCVDQWREGREKEERGEREHGGKGGGYNIREKEEREEGEEQREEWEEENPYVFEDRHFSSKFKTEQGRVRVLQKFTEKSKLLKGIENYRVEILEANPNTFIFPKHVDAEAVYVVLKGQGTITLIRENKRESSNVRPGDIIRIQAGTPIYMINRDGNEKLFVAKLLQPVSTPGQYEAFFGAGGDNPESFYRAFSTELLEAALKTKRDRLEKVFGQQKQGVIIKASKEQIRALSHHEEGGMWPFGGETKSGGPFNLFNKRPSHSNQYGRLHEVNSNDYKELQDLDLEVSFANISKGAMEGPFFISKATKIAFVVDGDGYFEMACPHLSSQQSRGRHQGGGSSEQRHGSQSYQKVSSRLRRGTVFVVPAGHPVAVVASNNQNLQIVFFDVNAQNNQKFSLAGNNNVMSLLQKEAKELAFGVSSREVDEVFGNNDEDFFFAGPHQQQGREGRAYA